MKTVANIWSSGRVRDEEMRKFVRKLDKETEQTEVGT